MFEKWASFSPFEKGWLVFSIFAAIASLCLIIYMIHSYRADMKRMEEWKIDWNDFANYIMRL